MKIAPVTKEISEMNNNQQKQQEQDEFNMTSTSALLICDLDDQNVEQQHSSPSSKKRRKPLEQSSTIQPSLPVSHADVISVSATNDLNLLDSENAGICD